MLKQWITNPDVGEIEVEEKYVQWSEQLRSDKYLTAPLALIWMCKAWYHASALDHFKKSLR